MIGLLLAMLGKERSDWSSPAMLGKEPSDWSSPGLVTLQEVCPLSSAITSDFRAAHVLSLECPSLRLVASTSYRAQSTRPVASGWEYT